MRRRSSSQEGIFLGESCLAPIVRLAWAQEAPGSNPGAPTTYFQIVSALILNLRCETRVLNANSG
jgi:hypothetical protein